MLISDVDKFHCRILINHKQNLYKVLKQHLYLRKIVEGRMVFYRSVHTPYLDFLDNWHQKKRIPENQYTNGTNEEQQVGANSGDPKE